VLTLLAFVWMFSNQNQLYKLVEFALKYCLDELSSMLQFPSWLPVEFQVQLYQPRVPDSLFTGEHATQDAFGDWTLIDVWVPSIVFSPEQSDVALSRMVTLSETLNVSKYAGRLMLLYSWPLIQNSVFV